LLSDGSHEITFEVQDDGGLWSEPVSETLIVGQVQAEIVIDNGDPGTSYTGGTWSVSSAPDPYGTESLWNRNGATYTWHADFPQSGMYEVYMWWTEWGSRSTNAPVKIYHNNGIEVVYVNQRENGGQWNLIGQFKFNPLDGGKLMLSAPDPSPISYCADAVKFVYVPCETRPCVSIMEPWDYYLQSSTDLYVQARVYEEQGGQTGLGVKFTLDGGQEIIDYDPPFETIFVNVGLSEHVVDAFLVDGNGDPVSGSSTHDQVVNVGVGNYYVAIGDSITFGYGDDNTLDDISSDGRNYGGGFEPLLNDFLTDNTAVPHDIINEGVSGADSSDGLAVIDGLLQKHTEAQRFLVQYGTNDAWPILPVPSGKGLEPGNPGYPGTFKDNMQQIIQAINNDEKEVCLAKPPIALGDSADGEPYEDPDNGQRSLLIKEYNEVIDELVSDSSNQIDIIPPDFYGYFNYYDPQAGTYRYEIEYFDNLHPNGQGYHSMAEQWFEALTQ
jgi:lysophospholipase L1-like esterase